MTSANTFKASNTYSVAVASRINKPLYYTYGANSACNQSVDAHQKNDAIDLPCPTSDSDKNLDKATSSLRKGALVKVPLGRRLVTGVVLDQHNQLPGDLKDTKLKSIQTLLPEDLWLPEELIETLGWAAKYYHQPLGKVLATALPGALLTGNLKSLNPSTGWRIADKQEIGAGELNRAPRQKALFSWLQENPTSTRAEIRAAGFDTPLLKQLSDKGLIEEVPLNIAFSEGRTPSSRLELLREQPPTLTSDQTTALEQINSISATDETNLKPILLDGVTGSGKTEIYLQATYHALASQKQILILVPEIGLISQTLRNFENRFGTPTYIYSSECNDSERVRAWRAACQGGAGIFIGTRSSIFLPFRQLGLIVVDEEHDLSYKQQEGFRYQARDLATLRSRVLKVPLILGSATPSIESLRNAGQDSYRHIRMQRRVKDRQLPKIKLLPVTAAQQTTLSRTSLDRIQQELDQGAQVMVFLNRRGYAPRLNCLNCGWFARCPHCDIALCKHLQPPQLICHHCDHRVAEPRQCPTCQSSQLGTLGKGTEQIEQELSQFFPGSRCIRIDRDSTSTKGSFHAHLEPALNGDSCIIVGTQMLAKGHHLPKLSLAIIVDADQALFSQDYRAAEYLGQLVTQVAGRTGRGEQIGELIVETNYPEHPLLINLAEKPYKDYAEDILSERASRSLPPFSYASILRAESGALQTLIDFMTIAEQSIRDGKHKKIELIGPMPAVMERRRGRFRYQLSLFSTDRNSLHHALHQLCFVLDNVKGASSVRWGIDVDPLTTD